MLSPIDFVEPVLQLWEGSSESAPGLVFWEVSLQAVIQSATRVLPEGDAAQVFYLVQW